jgi:hypothetical protein
MTNKTLYNIFIQLLVKYHVLPEMVTYSVTNTIITNVLSHIGVSFKLIALILLFL